MIKPIEFECPECSESLKATSEMIGAEVECPYCETAFDLQMEPYETSGETVATESKRGRKVAYWITGSLGVFTGLLALMIYLGPLSGLGDWVMYTKEARIVRAENERIGKELEAKFKEIEATRGRLKKNYEEMERKKRNSERALQYEMEKLNRALGR